MLPNVQQETIKPVINQAVKQDSMIYTDEYDIYARLEKWGFGHETVCHGKGEYARDDDADGFCEVHVNTMEGCWSLLRSWLRPHRGISQEKLPSEGLAKLNFSISIAFAPPTQSRVKFGAL